LASWITAAVTSAGASWDMLSPMPVFMIDGMDPVYVGKQLFPYELIELLIDALVPLRIKENK
jgi:hypothetical protein